ncbi:DUF2911 domain-containing protein [Mangrovimonas sp. YM274]|uniref:DUF2911 domain-containing protein n=1 Tax=Mangrovimonas sp. YM274 TaxID=3070660 RepID=UPI0027DCAC07|nr:DUF2911 domain-containing protein [Mangrovimonas sp. YM274]WMI67947.1 DUF2911 domain-containing protein [Mangrovimonas sp. YM274]
MKNRIITTLLLAFTLLLSEGIAAQEFSDLDKSPMDAVAYPTSHRESNKAIKVIYSRPQLKGRPLSKLTPDAKVWRTGANEATEITFYKDVNFAGKDVKAGTYSMFTIPGDKQWTIILNSATNVWGAYSYDESQDIARVTVPVSEDKKALEAFSITFDKDATMYLGWHTLRVAIPIQVK